MMNETELKERRNFLYEEVLVRLKLDLADLTNVYYETLEEKITEIGLKVMAIRQIESRMDEIQQILRATTKGKGR